jgi:hypothetical protein
VRLGDQLHRRRSGPLEPERGVPVILGSKHRYIGLACLAAGQLAKAVDQLALAADENSDFAVLETRTRFDLARALIRQPGSYSRGVAEMERVAERAAELSMAGLAAQAAAESIKLTRPDGGSTGR